MQETSTEQDQPRPLTVLEQELRRRMEASWAAEAEEEMSFCVRMLTGTGLLSTNDIRMMLRGQVLQPAMGCKACHPYTESLERSDHQLHVMPPDRPTEAARNDLFCPLHERALRGALVLPCAGLYEDSLDDDENPTFDRFWLPPRTESDRVQQELLRQIHWSELSPCEFMGDLSEVIISKLCDEAGVPRRPQTPMPPLIDQGQALLKLGGDPQDGRLAAAKLQFLVATRRIDAWDLVNMVPYQLPVTDLEWLPCRHDKRRFRYFPGRCHLPHSPRTRLRATLPAAGPRPAGGPHRALRGGAGRAARSDLRGRRGALAQAGPCPGGPGKGTAVR